MSKELGIILAALVSAGILVSGCSMRVQESEVYGVYLAEYENGRQKLTLENGGKYVQEITPKGTDRPTSNSGPWKYDHSSNRVELQDCLGVGDGFGKIRPDFATNRGGCSFPVERRWLITGRLRLGPDEASPLWKIQ